MRQASDPDFAPPVEEGMIYAFQDEKGETINLEFLGLILHNDRRYGFFVPDAEHEFAVQLLLRENELIRKSHTSLR